MFGFLSMSLSVIVVSARACGFVEISYPSLFLCEFSLTILPSDRHPHLGLGLSAHGHSRSRTVRHDDVADSLCTVRRSSVRRLRPDSLACSTWTTALTGCGRTRARRTFWRVLFRPRSCRDKWWDTVARDEDRSDRQPGETQVGFPAGFREGHECIRVEIGYTPGRLTRSTHGVPVFAGPCAEFPQLPCRKALEGTLRQS